MDKEQNFNIKRAFTLYDQTQENETVTMHESCDCGSCNCGDTCVFEDVPGPTFAVTLAANAAIRVGISAGEKAFN